MVLALIAAAPLTGGQVWRVSLVATVDASGRGGQLAAPRTSVGGCPAEPAAFDTCAQQKAKSFDPPRTPDGHPDMQGYWTDLLTNGFSIEGVTESDPDSRNPVQAATVGPGMIVDPPDGKIPYQPWAAALGRKGVHTKAYLDPHGTCALHGPPRNMEISPIYQLIQPSGGDYIVWLLEEIHEFRIIPTNNRRHIGSNIKLWGGDSIGRWEGNTLVVDVTNLNGYNWLDDAGNFFTDAAHMVERWTMIDPDTIHYRVTLEDPRVYSRPWTMAWAFVREKTPGFELLEEACWEGDRDLPTLRNIGLKPYYGETWRGRGK
jgi:hypothetical protein